MTLTLSQIWFQWSRKSPFAISIGELTVARGETVLLLGESGSGKSTILSLISGTLLPAQGSVIIDGIDITTLSAGARDQFRAEKMGVIFQQFNLLPFGTVQDNILLPLHFAPERRRRAGLAAKKVTELCNKLGLPRGIEQTKASRLSVGQQQRVAVARALIGEPALIVADEPTSALDANSQAAFLELLFAQTKTKNTSLLMVSHDARLSVHFDRVIHIEDIAKIERTSA